jgi:predicted aspartyl protease
VFLLDTGATQSILTPIDADALGLEPKGLFPDPRAQTAPGFGGDVRFIATAADLMFGAVDDPGPPLRMILGIVEPTRRSLALPSVLGMDFLRHFRLTLSASEDLVELERLV